jgi:hypothetical protein
MWKRTSVVVTTNGRPSAVILGITDEDEIGRLSLAYSPKFNRILDSARREIRRGSGVAHGAFWVEMGGTTWRQSQYTTRVGEVCCAPRRESPTRDRL